jgi:large subunit ribosomal protein L18e
MPHPTGPTDENMRKVIVRLRKAKEKHLADIAKHLAKSRRSKSPVNLSRLVKMSGKHEALVVPGKVLGAGTVNKSIKVYAWSFSKEARQKIQHAGGHALNFDDLLKDKPKARVVK